MPRYFFHIHHGNRHADETGVELPGKDAAWKEAIFTTGQLLQDLDGALESGREWRLEVSDEAENPVCIVHVLAERH
ncbi:hypothetical protein [Bradyrhizobium sp. CCBAU 53421]|uniref:DUF6894 family protein n=1 Tax=Bradyrhizobium sp. CCBAU 53421 TaxID=1325120 RepID=UPI00188D0F07|nr:hypothetical protein [Bradyrhizobium sp. CCBAU 53421]QOZ36905.1 hypothetical protein XH92_39575 [Bradyrhizobium sp. CCBAU 53421]